MTTILTLATGREVTVAATYEVIAAALQTGQVETQTICGRRFAAAAGLIQAIEDAPPILLPAAKRAFGFAQALEV